MPSINALEFIPLEKTLYSPRAGEQIISFCQSSQIDWATWQIKVRAWQQCLSHHQEEKWAVFHHDSAEFSAILFALWSLNKISCIAGSNNPATTTDLGNHADGFIGQFEGHISKPYLQQVDLDVYNTQNLTFEPKHLYVEQPLIEIFTSGSSGKPLAITKTLKQLSQEISSLEQLWGDELKTASIVSTVSHQHIYGLLFRVLWPICAQRAFHRFNFEFIEDLANNLDSIGDYVLVSSPTHLSRLPQGLEKTSLQNLVKTVFSSGAPLQLEDSQRANKFFKTAINEVFGSSETGGIAWRQQHNDQYKHWKTLPNIIFEIDQDSGCLKIQSPHLPSDNDYLTSDLAQAIDQHSFKLLGRSDKIVKVEGKRLSITAMENCLLAQSCIEEARIIVLENERLDNKRSEVCAALVLNQEGRIALAKLGRLQFSWQLKEILLQKFERPLLPRRWRFVDAFNRNSQSKVLHQGLIDLFMQTIPHVILPVIIETERENDSSVALDLIVPKELRYFDGHFDQHPILPGVVQTHWAEHYAREHFKFSNNFVGLSNIKFQQIISPGQQVKLALTLIEKNDTAIISFAYSSSIGKHASGKLTFS